MSIRYTIGDCEMGRFLVAASSKGVCWVALGDDSDMVAELSEAFPDAGLEEQGLEHEVCQILSWINDPATAVDLALDMRGSEFQTSVWQQLRAIPAGETRTYIELARALGDENATRAVAGACAANTLALLIPCHRAVRVDGGLAGFRWGIERKRWLLDREARLYGQQGSLGF